MTALLAGLASGGGADKIWVDSVFSAYTYQGNGSTQIINNGIDLAGKGGMVWTKSRSNYLGFNDHNLVDSTRGLNKSLYSNLTQAQDTDTASIASFNSNGYSLGNFDYNNQSTESFVSWTFRNARDVFQVLSVTKSAGSSLAIDLSPYMSTVGMVRVKRTDAAGSWYVWHRSLSAGKLLIGETTAAEATLGHITVVGTTLTLVNGIIADGTYHVEAYAHDTSPDGLIQCGSFTTDGSGNATVNLGCEPQYLMWKRTDGIADWNLFDSSRGMTVAGSVDANIAPNSSAAEQSSNYMSPSSNGFSYLVGAPASATYIYLAIRRSNKPPTSGTQVYNAIARTGTGAAATVTGAGFAPDLVIPQARSGSSVGALFWDRLRGVPNYLNSSVTTAEGASLPGSFTSLSMDGGGIDAGEARANYSATTYINHFFKRAPGVFDTVCYTGTGVAHTEAHGLGVVPELMIVKARNSAQPWLVNIEMLPTTSRWCFLQSDQAQSSASPYGGAYLSAQPTESGFSVTGSSYSGGSGTTYVAYLFASKAGISCVKSFVGDGTTGRVIDCGFTAGARFILIKSTSAVGSWWIFDSVRGIVAAADPALQLNSTAAEITSADAVDPEGSGFIVNQEATCSLNATGVSYLVLAIA